jgi:hypothetical protein
MSPSAACVDVYFGQEVNFVPGPRFIRADASTGAAMEVLDLPLGQPRRIEIP